MPKKQPTSTDIHVGKSIRARRLIAGMSQSDLATRIGVSFQQVQKYEKGVNRIGAGRLMEIARIFNVPVSALYEANADLVPGAAKTNHAPVALISDHGALRLLASYTDIRDRGIRRGLTQLVDVIAKAARKQPRKVRGREA